MMGEDPYSAGIYTYTRAGNIQYESFSMTGNIMSLILNTDPYSAGKYTYTRQSGDQADNFNMTGTPTTFTLVQTYFPNNYIYLNSSAGNDSFQMTGKPISFTLG